MSEDFYWRTARDSTFTTAALQVFQLLSKYDGQPFNQACESVDSEWERVRQKPLKRHGGMTKTAARAFQEVGWLQIQDANGDEIVKVTPAGKQAIELMASTPDYLKMAPHFLLTLLNRFQLNNPARPAVSKNREYDEKLAKSDIFPYRTLFRVMRALDNKIRGEELQRYVFKIQKESEVENTIKSIRKFRQDRESRKPESQINEDHPHPIYVSKDQAKYLMGRLGTQIGKFPPVLIKNSASEWEIEPSWVRLIDQLIDSGPEYKEYISEAAWMDDYGRPVAIEDDSHLHYRDPEEEFEEENYNLIDDLPDNDPLWQEVQSLIDAGNREICLAGVPGTGKTWYAQRIATKLINADSQRLAKVQFHPSFGYDDFVEGYVPSANNKQSSFELRDKTFKRLCNRALRDASNLYVMIIDELSRGDVSRIFGELLTYIEYRGQGVKLAYSNRLLIIPENLIILATMNPHDRSVAELDDAMNRRFLKVDVPPSVDALRSILIKNEVDNELLGKIIGFFTWLKTNYPPGIGHGYFENIRHVDDLERTWKYKILPKLEKDYEFANDSLSEIIKKFQAKLLK